MTFPQIQNTFSRYSTLTFIGAKKKRGGTADKVVNDVLSNWISFFRAIYYFNRRRPEV